jgi:hypothetical protein
LKHEGERIDHFLFEVDVGDAIGAAAAACAMMQKPSGRLISEPKFEQLKRLRRMFYTVRIFEPSLTSLA